ncbi:hypothetical protein RhiirC2_756806, partial [Rhizophagus irregularis]
MQENFKRNNRNFDKNINYLLTFIQIIESTSILYFTYLNSKISQKKRQDFGFFWVDVFPYLTD